MLCKKGIKTGAFHRSLHLVWKRHRRNATSYSSAARESRRDVANGGVEQPHRKNSWLHKANRYPTVSPCEPDWPDVWPSKKWKTASDNPCRRPTPAHSTSAQQVRHHDANSVDSVRPHHQQEHCHEATSGCWYQGISSIPRDDLDPSTSHQPSGLGKKSEALAASRLVQSHLQRWKSVQPLPGWRQSESLSAEGRAAGSSMHSRSRPLWRWQRYGLGRHLRWPEDRFGCCPPDSNSPEVQGPGSAAGSDPLHAETTTWGNPPAR